MSPKLTVIDLAGVPLYYFAFASAVFTDAPGQTVHNAFTSVSVPFDSLMIWAKPTVGVEDGSTFEAEARYSFEQTYSTAVRSCLWPPSSIHKHSDAPYNDSDSHMFPIPLLLRKGQTIYGNAIAINTGLANATIQFTCVCGVVPISAICDVPVPEYNPQRL